MRRPRLSLIIALAASLTLFSLPALSAVNGFTPPEGYEAEDLGLQGDTFAVSADGRLAVARNAVITIYSSAGPEGRSELATIADPRLGSLGGLSFTGAGLLVSENGAQDTVFLASLLDGSLTALAPAGSIPNPAQVRARPGDGSVFALSSNNPGQGAIYRLAGGAAQPFATGIGTGYLGGLAFGPGGEVYAGDSNDPFFLGKAGRILTLDASGAPTGALALDGGNGSGVYDIAADAAGTLYATTGATLTRVRNGAASPFGAFDGAFPFPTDIAVDATGGVIVNGAYTGAGGLFRVRPVAAPVPEPSTLALAGLGLLPLVARRRAR